MRPIPNTYRREPAACMVTVITQVRSRSAIKLQAALLPEPDDCYFKKTPTAPVSLLGNQDGGDLMPSSPCREPAAHHSPLLPARLIPRGFPFTSLPSGPANPSHALRADSLTPKSDKASPLAQNVQSPAPSLTSLIQIHVSPVPANFGSHCALADGLFKTAACLSAVVEELWGMGMPTLSGSTSKLVGVQAEYNKLASSRDFLRSMGTELVSLL